MSRTSRKLLSQNFLCNRELVSKLIRSSSVSQNDTVLEIGSGCGIITEQLLGVCKKLTAFETDQKFVFYLRRRFPKRPNFHLFSGDFLSQPLPQDEPFKVFSNIPFSITGEIVKKLMFSKNSPVDSYLVVQREAAETFIVNKHRNTMLAILFYPWFNIRIVHEFERSDFKPKPRVNSCLIRIVKRSPPFVGESNVQLYRDFIVYHFGRKRLAPAVTPSQWLTKFDEFIKKHDPRMLNRIRGSFTKWQAEERKLSKIHRTRTGAWRVYCLSIRCGVY